MGVNPPDNAMLWYATVRAAGKRPVTALRDHPLAKVYQLVEPGPVVLLVTADKGRANVMAMSWHMMMEFEPPLIGVW